MKWGSPELRVLVVAFGAFVGCRKGSPAPDTTTLHVAAAADLADAFPEIGEAFTKATGTPVAFTYGATGLLEAQVAEGAPYDVFAGANVSFVDDAVKTGICFADSEAKYATGRLAMWTKAGASFVPHTLADLAKPDVVHVAIANPAHAPYGKAAKEAIERSGQWGAIEKKVVYGENVQQTLQFAQSGNAEVAVVSQSLAARAGGVATAVDPSLHAPIEQAIVACKGGVSADGKLQPAAREFAAFVASPQGRAILAKYGFGPPTP